MDKGWAGLTQPNLRTLINRRFKIFGQITKTPLRAALFVFLLTSFIVFIITAFWPQLSSWVFPNTTLGLYDKSFWENVLVEAHGLVFDIFLIGLVLVWMDVHRQNRESIERNLEGLWDLNTLTDEIYQKKKTNIIKRLNSSKVYKIDVTDLTLNDVDIRGAIFFDSALYGLKLINCRAFNLEIKKSRLNSAEFIDSKLKNTKILDSFLKNANFTRAKLSGADFRKSDLLRAKFIDANLESADLRECNLKSAVFNGANLRQVNIKQCKNINCEELIKASCLDYIKADDYIVEFIKERRPEIKIDLVR